MADSAGQVSSKTSEKSKFSNSVTRTTSETLRLNESDKPVNQPNTLSTSTTNPRKKTSFQITSVTVVGSRTSNDGGDDSADDLDESHTDDISEAIDVSRDIENETPSYSEDTFSKDDVFFNASASLGTAPVIPTSSQYGLAILATPDNCETILHPTDSCGNSVTGAELHMGVADNVINLGVVSTKPDPEMRDIHTHQARHERFKVVKIESTEPFKRGRWVCMDYLDHSISQPKPNSGKSDVSLTKPADNTGKGIELNEHSPQNYSTTESIVSTAETITTVGTPATEESLPASEQVSKIIPASLPQIDNSQQLPITNPQNLPSTYSSSVSPGQSLQGNVQMVSTGMNTSNQVPQQAQSLSQVPIQQQVPTSTNQHQSLQPQQIQQVLANASVIPVQQQQTNMQSQPQLVQQTMQQMQPVQQQQQQQPQQFQQQFQPIQQQQQPMMQQQIPQQPMQQQMQQVQQVHMQNVPQNIQTMPMQQPQGQSLPQPIMQPQTMQQIPQQTSQIHQVSFSQPMPQQTITQTTTQPQVQGMMQQTFNPQQMQGFQQNQMMTNVQTQGMMNVQSQPHMQQQYYSNMQPIQQGMTAQGQMLPPMSQGSSMPQVSIHGSSAHIPLQNFPVTSLPQQMMPPNMPQTPPIATSVPSYPVQFPPPHLSTPTNQPPSATPQTVHPVPNMIQQGYVNMGSTAQTYVQQSVVSSVPSTDQTTTVPAMSEVISVESTNPPAALLESLAEVTNSAEETPQGEESESASGASAVAIDNKIEQAMDLVKSHLMFAVREEVEVLKEKIAELMDRINQLEVENTILRANATQETLAQLPPPPNNSQQQPANPP